MWAKGVKDAPVWLPALAGAILGLGFASWRQPDAPEQTPQQDFAEMERRLEAELQQTSYKEWRAAGFEPAPGNVAERGGKRGEGSGPAAE
mmetsp:Transcript_66651/g.159313  ORF Transcript_66651/g.159313 Transcript_66651/m.159313 type:complete len:90 (-) Transcript_66651:133-402(-)